MVSPQPATATVSATRTRRIFPESEVISGFSSLQFLPLLDLHPGRLVRMRWMQVALDSNPRADGRPGPFQVLKPLSPCQNQQMRRTRKAQSQETLVVNQRTPGF